VRAGHDDVELLQARRLVIQAPVREDVDLAAGEQRDALDAIADAVHVVDVLEQRSTDRPLVIASALE
jgi:hypothetical protein